MDNYFIVRIGKNSKLEFVCPHCGSTDITLTQHPVGTVEKMVCNKCGGSLQRELTKDEPHQITMEEYMEASR